MEVHESWQNVGKHIRTIRKQNQLSLRQLANGCGLSTNAISLIERGQVAPSVDSLCKIAGALGVRASSFLQEICPSEINIVRAQQTKPNDPLQYFQELKTNACTFSGFKTIEEKIYCQEMVLCMSGIAEFEDSDGQTHIISTGDQLICNGSAPQRWNNVDRNPAVLVMVLTTKEDHQSQNQ